MSRALHTFRCQMEQKYLYFIENNDNLRCQAQPQNKIVPHFRKTIQQIKFIPNSDFTRAMLCAIMYRKASALSSVG